MKKKRRGRKGRHAAPIGGESTSATTAKLPLNRRSDRRESTDELVRASMIEMDRPAAEVVPIRRA